MLKHFKEYSANMFPCVQVSMIDQRHAYLCVQACTERAFTLFVLCIQRGAVQWYIYICLNMTRVNS